MMNGRRIAFFVVCVLWPLLFLSCPQLFSKLDNPADPDSDYYLGYPTVFDPDELTLVSPTNGGTLTETTLTVSRVAGAAAYAVRIAASADALGTANLYEKSDYTTNVPDVSIAPLLNGTTYYWQARASKGGAWGQWTSTASFKTGWTTPASKPTFDPPGGTYTNDQSVTISSATIGATIWYTTDGTNPTSSNTRQSGASPVGPIAISVNPATTIRAIATAPGYSASAERNATYTEAPAELSVSVVFDLGSEDPISPSVPSTIMRGNVLNFSVSESFDSFQWYLDGALCSSDQSGWIDTGTLGLGLHELSIFVTRNGLLTTASYRFTVSN